MSDSDFLTIRAEAPPRSAATCKQVAGHAESVPRLIGGAILWILVAWIAVSIPIAVGVALLPGEASPAQAAVILGSSGVVFVLSWVAFAVLVLRRRRAHRTIVRDGMLVDGVIVERRPGKLVRTTVQFRVGGIEHRALVRIAPDQQGGTVPILCMPGARQILAFPGGRSGHAVMATIHNDVVVDHSAHQATIVFTRGASETFFAAVLALTAMVLPLVIFVGAKLPPSRLSCERNNDACQVETFDIFGGSSNFSFKISDLARSVVRDRNGDSQWVIRRKVGGDIEMTGATGDAAQAAVFKERSQAFAAFIADPSQPALTLEYRATGRPALPVLIIISVVALVLVLRWAHGRRTTLTIDSRAGTLTIWRHPTLIPPARRTLPLSSISHADVRSGAIFLLYAMIPTLRLWLRDTNGQVVFSRWQFTSRTAQDEVRAVSDLLARKDRI